MSSWIKMRTDLMDCPRVVRISSACDADMMRTIGALWSVWCWFDLHSTDGFMEGMTTEVLDRRVGMPGFAAAMSGVGWLVSDAKGLRLPDFDKHNGGGAKRRAVEAVRKMSARDADKVQTPCRQTAPQRERESKSREEIPKAQEAAAPLPSASVPITRAYGTPVAPDQTQALLDRWEAARAVIGIGPATPQCRRMIPGVIDEIANSVDLDPADRDNPMAFLIRQLDAYLASREARAAPLTRLGNFLRGKDGRRKWLEGPEVWNHERKAPEPAKLSLAEQILARDRGTA